MMHAPPLTSRPFALPIYLNWALSLGVAVEVLVGVFVAGWITHADKVDINYGPKTKDRAGRWMAASSTIPG